MAHHALTLPLPLPLPLTLTPAEVSYDPVPPLGQDWGPTESDSAHDALALLASVCTEAIDPSRAE